MNNSESLDALFRQAVSAMDAGDVPAIERLLALHPRLVRERLESSGDWLRGQVGNALDGFFQRPYLLWFVAEDPIRTGKLPANIAQIACAIIQAAKREGVDSLREQLDYALRLVAWSLVARECDVQAALIDALLDAGAEAASCTHDALVNGNIAAAERLVERGAPLTLATALCLGRWNEVTRLGQAASARDKQIGLVLAALNGKDEALRRLLDLGVDLNAYSVEIFEHATALHQAVCSGSLNSVKALVEAGADLDMRDKAWQGTPLGWAEYYQSQHAGDERGTQYAQIAAYLREKESQR